MVPHDVKQSVETRRKEHFDLVALTNTQFKQDVEDAVNSLDETIVLTFDLEKTLATPSLTTNVSFYKRALWTYNLCVYDEVYKKGQFFGHLFSFYTQIIVRCCFYSDNVHVE